MGKTKIFVSEISFVSIPRGCSAFPATFVVQREMAHPHRRGYRLGLIYRLYRQRCLNAIFPLSGRSRRTTADRKRRKSGHVHASRSHFVLWHSEISRNLHQGVGLHPMDRRSRVAERLIERATDCRITVVTQTRKKGTFFLFSSAFSIRTHARVPLARKVLIIYRIRV